MDERVRHIAQARINVWAEDSDGGDKAGGPYAVLFGRNLTTRETFVKRQRNILGERRTREHVVDQTCSLNFEELYYSKASQLEAVIFGPNLTYWIEIEEYDEMNTPAQVAEAIVAHACRPDDRSLTEPETGPAAIPRTWSVGWFGTDPF